ncbi:MAG: sulfite exporter TauE/SafE family protein [Acidimicrobiia bacterium]|nr:sulfite exporter TauE/SafE family protein [Acidimicrobiia bacterium]
MLGLSLGMAIACILAVYVGSTVQASVGIGLGMLASPVLALADPDFIPATIVICVVPLSISIAWTDRHHIDGRGFLLAILGRLPGVVVGALLAASLTDDVLTILVAGSVLGAVAASLSGRHFRPTDPAVVSAGLASGFTGTTTGVGGPPMALVYQHSDPAIMRSTIAAFFAVGAGMSVTALWIAGEVGRRQLELAAMLLPGVILGVVTAHYVRGRLDPAAVRPAVLAICAGTSALLLLKTFW